MADELEEISKLKPSREGQDVPFSLREFGEIPENYVPLYIVVKKENLDRIGKYGFRTADNRSGERLGAEAENTFQEVATDLGVVVSREKVIFASPRTPDKVKFGTGFDEASESLLMVMVDPSNLVVANGIVFSERHRT